MRRVIVAATAASLAGVLGAGGLAYAGTTSGTSSPGTVSSSAAPGATSPGTSPGAASPGASGKARHAQVHGAARHHPALFRRAVHLQAVVQGKNHTFHTWEMDRGLFAGVTSSSGTPTSITITRPDGVKVKARLTTSTKFPKLAESQLGTGDHLVVVQRDGTATRVVARAPKPAT